jgi:sec-independent protein translocase protein TatB
MFDIGFWELALIGVVALLVVGPDRLPGLARTVGLWVGRIRRYVANVRDDIEREIQADELKKMLEKTEDLDPLQEIVDETSDTIGIARKEIVDVEKDASEMLSDESAASTTGAPDVDAGDDDETGTEPLTPDSAATAIGEAVSGKESVATPEPAVEEAQDDERRTQ